jgi:hypothetical protein
MDAPARTLVAVMSNGAEHQTHTLYFSDGTVVGYDPTLGRVLRVHQLPADLGEAQPVAIERHRSTTPAVVPSLIDRRREARD